MKRLLFIAHRVPFPPDKGERVRAFHEIKALSAHFEITPETFAVELAPARTFCFRSEVEQLRSALSAPEPSHGELNQGLHGVRDRLAALSDELFGDALKGSDYIARIGRILGLS